MDTTKAPELLTSNEVAKLARVSPSTVISWARRGVVPGIRAGGSWRFRRADIEALLTPVTPEDGSPSVV